MSDKRRRRRKASDDSSGEEDEASITASDHEYESAAEDSALEESDVELDKEIDSPTSNNTVDPIEKDQQTSIDKVTSVLEEVKIVEDNLEVDEVLELHSDKDDDNEVLEDVENEDLGEDLEDWHAQEERGAGDGQEQKDEKVDDDEDRRNPQYIPKKGMFYEHDDRIDSGDEEAAKEGGLESEKADADKPRRVPRSETVEKWGHDKFLDRDQAPKSKEELVTAYGYDIRNEDNAPRARRRRRYGRGPNKYTRNWEDEEAYEGKGGPKDSSAPNDAEDPSDAPRDAPRDAPANSNRGGRSERGNGGAPNSNFRGGNRGRGVARNNAKNSSNGTVEIDDKEQFPALGGPASNRNESNNQNRSEKENFNNVVRGQRGGGQVRGRGGPRGGGFGGRGGGKVDKPRSDYSANQRLNKEPRPVENASQQPREKPNKSEAGGIHPRSENHKGQSKIIQDQKARDSPSSNRKDRGSNLEESDQRQPKRYSNTRQGIRNSNNQRHQGSRSEANATASKQEYYGGQEQINGSAAPGVGPQGNFVNSANFPTNASGPPPAAPFLPAGVAVAATPTSTSGFLDPTAMVNYGPPPPVQFAPLTVPVTVTVPLVSMTGGAVHDTIAVLAPPPNVALGNPNVSAPDQVLLAAAQAATANQGYAEVRGGVTYFNPQAQHVPVLARPVPMGKRPKAAIPIVDPSQVVGSTMSPQSSTEDIEEHNNIIDGSDGVSVNT